jgi:hypothetical protein
MESSVFGVPLVGAGPDSGVVELAEGVIRTVGAVAAGFSWDAEVAGLIEPCLAPDCEAADTACGGSELTTV